MLVIFTSKRKQTIFLVAPLSSLFEIALSFVRFQSVNLAMDGNLPDALKEMALFGLYILLLFYRRL